MIASIGVILGGTRGTRTPLFEVGVPYPSLFTGCPRDDKENASMITEAKSLFIDFRTCTYMYTGEGRWAV